MFTRHLGLGCVLMLFAACSQIEEPPEGGGRPPPDQLTTETSKTVATDEHCDDACWDS